MTYRLRTVTSQAGRGAACKTLIAGAVELRGRGLGRARLQVIPDAPSASLDTFLHAHASPGPTLITEAWTTADLLQRSDHRSVQALEADIRTWVKGWNENPKPFIWTKSAEQILDSLKRLLKRTTGAGH
jgi:hypothetical protein